MLFRLNTQMVPANLEIPIYMNEEAESVSDISAPCLQCRLSDASLFLNPHRILYHLRLDVLWKQDVRESDGNVR